MNELTTAMEGQRVPDVAFRAREGGDWKNVTSSDLFSDRTVVVFSLPGAFTPTCSSSHLPRYNELVPVLKENGVDEVVCLSVNDGFVMEAWAQAQNATGVTVLPDGNGEFTDGMGMLVDKNDLGFGKRSWRYSMLVKDGAVEKMFIEPDQPGDPFVVSDADTMLNYINAQAEVPEAVTMFTRAGCSHCTRAKKALDDVGMVYEEVKLGGSITNCTLMAVAGQATTPQVFVGGKLVGSADQLDDWLAAR